MPNDLLVFHLGATRPESVKLWIEEFRAYLSKDQAFIGDRSVSLIESDHPEEALWIGRPFILAGERDVVESWIRRLSAEELRILHDCAYCWVLSDTDDFLLSPERVITLNWSYKLFEVIAVQLRSLFKYPRLAGLSRGLHHVRAEIERITATPTGPWTPTLILGQSGTGKDEVARSLYSASERTGGFAAVACGWFVETLLQDELFGHVRGAHDQAHRDKMGFLEKHSKGVVFLDDLDAAVKTIMGSLLRIMATEKGQPAKFHPLGAEDADERKTDVWLIFSTNADVQQLLKEGNFREDFFFRFGDRVIHLQPLRERPADIPAIAHRIWDDLWLENPKRKRPLSPPVLQHLLTRETKWTGNVRALQALLSLTASMANLPAHDHHGLRRVLDEILSRGPEYHHWVGIISTPAFTTGQFTSGNSDVQSILKLDEGYYCNGLTKEHPDSPKTGSEKEVEDRLTPAGLKAFGQVVNVVQKKRGKENVVRPSVRLARIIAYVARGKEADRHICVDLCSIADAVAMADLKLLKEAGVLKQCQAADHNHKVTTYQAVPGFFRSGH